LTNHDLFVKHIRSNRLSREKEKREIKPQALCMSVFSDDWFVCTICCNRILVPHSNNWRRRRSSKLSLFCTKTIILTNNSYLRQKLLQEKSSKRKATLNCEVKLGRQSNFSWKNTRQKERASSKALRDFSKTPRDG
jgi:hypothetical protein